MAQSDPPAGVAEVIRMAQARHPRLYEGNRYVYPVLSRRSKGISIGVNLNPDKICNFDCIYCQVDRTVAPVLRDVDLDLLEQEVRGLLAAEREGRLNAHPPFAGLPPELRRVNDIAFSGDGEPTSYPEFREAAERVVRAKEGAGRPEIKVVVITNATLFHRPLVREALAFLDRHQGEVWAKLDAGTEAYYRLVERTTIPFDRVVRNLIEAARVRPLVIQSLFMCVHGTGPGAEEIDAYCGILRRIVDEGGRLKLVQVYTVARRPAEGYVTSLKPDEVNRIGDRVRRAVEAPVEVFYGIG